MGGQGDAGGGGGAELGLWGGLGCVSVSACVLCLVRPTRLARLQPSCCPDSLMLLTSATLCGVWRTQRRGQRGRRGAGQKSRRRVGVSSTPTPQPPTFPTPSLTANTSSRTMSPNATSGAVAVGRWRGGAARRGGARADVDATPGVRERAARICGSVLSVLGVLGGTKVCLECVGCFEARRALPCAETRESLTRAKHFFVPLRGAKPALSLSRCTRGGQRPDAPRRA